MSFRSNGTAPARWDGKTLFPTARSLIYLLRIVWENEVGGLSETCLGGSASCEGWRQLLLHESVDNAALMRGDVMAMVACLVRVQGISQTKTLFELKAMDNVHEGLAKV